MTRSTSSARRRVCWHDNSIMLVLVLLVLPGLWGGNSVEGQRVIASLGTRLKKLHNRNRSSNNKFNNKKDQAHIVQGEQLIGVLLDFAKRHFGFLVGIITTSTILLALLWSTRSNKKKDGELFFAFRIMRKAPVGIGAPTTPAATDLIQIQVVLSRTFFYGLFYCCC
jgi:hypothetical protein